MSANARFGPEGMSRRQTIEYAVEGVIAAGMVYLGGRVWPNQRNQYYLIKPKRMFDTTEAREAISGLMNLTYPVAAAADRLHAAYSRHYHHCKFVTKTSTDSDGNETKTITKECYWDDPDSFRQYGIHPDTLSGWDKLMVGFYNKLTELNAREDPFVIEGVNDVYLQAEEFDAGVERWTSALSYLLSAVGFVGYEEALDCVGAGSPFKPYDETYMADRRSFFKILGMGAATAATIPLQNKHRAANREARERTEEAVAGIVREMDKAPDEVFTGHFDVGVYGLQHIHDRYTGEIIPLHEKCSSIADLIEDGAIFDNSWSRTVPEDILYGFRELARTHETFYNHIGAMNASGALEPITDFVRFLKGTDMSREYVSSAKIAHYLAPFVEMGLMMLVFGAIMGTYEIASESKRPSPRISRRRYWG
jgi:hypothetical protein